MKRRRTIRRKTGKNLTVSMVWLRYVRRAARDGRKLVEEAKTALSHALIFGLRERYLDETEHRKRNIQ